MGGKQSVPVLNPLDILSQQTSSLKRSFQSLSGSQGYIPKPSIIELIRSRLHTYSRGVVHRAMEVVTYSGESNCTFHEYTILWYILTLSKLEHRLKFVFHMFDISGTGVITKKDFQKATLLLMTPEEQTPSSEIMPLVGLFVHCTFVKYCAPGENALSYSEWLLYAEADEFISDIAFRIGPQFEENEFPTLK